MKKLLAIGSIVLFFVFIIFSSIKGKSTLDQKYKEVNQSYFALKDPLSIRYEAIVNAMNIAKTIGGDRDVIEDTYKLYEKFQKESKKSNNLAETIILANEIEGNYSRLIKASDLSPKLKNHADLKAAFENVNNQSPREYLITDYQNAVKDYNKTKTKFWRKLSASIFSPGQAPQYYLKNT